MRAIPTTDGLTLGLHEHGGTGRPVLLCHATGFHGAVWEPLSAALGDGFERWAVDRSEEHTSELQSLMRISYAVFCLKKKKTSTKSPHHQPTISYSSQHQAH